MHSTTFQRLKGNGLEGVEKFDEQPPQTAEKSVESIKQTLGIHVNHGSSTPTNVQKALGKAYNGETAFDQALFSALRADLIAMGVEVTDLEGQTNENKMVIKNFPCNNASYAFGFARQARRETNKPHDKKLDISAAVNMTGAKHSDCDHTCCVFKKSKEGKWNIAGVFAVVELKMSDTSSKCEKNLLINDPIIQAICYVIEHVWPDICKFGLVEVDPEKKEKMESLPIALIAAEKENTTPTDKFKRLVKGSLLLPKRWGDTFEVQSNFFQPFVKPLAIISESPQEPEDAISSQSNADGDDRMEEDGDQMDLESDDEWENQATNLYMEFIHESIKLLRECCKNCNRELPFPSPVSGSPPRPSDGYDGYDGRDGHDYCGSPVLSMEDLEQFQDPQQPKYYISQGDLHFFKSLELSIFDDDDDDDDNDDNDKVKWLVEDSEVTNVFVKVWSNTVHRALQAVVNYREAYDKIMTNRNSDLKESLSEVLIGAVFKPSAALTITRKIKGSAVKPVTLKDKEDYKSELKRYWKLFKGLCKDVLLPLAKVGIVHQDLRPGHDCTYNVMIETTENDATTKMRLIDYESLCKVLNYQRPPTPQGYLARYPSKLKREEKPYPWAYDFLFQQCVGVAYAWINEKDAKDMDFDIAMKWFWEKLQQKLTEDVKNGKKDAIEWWLSSLTAKRHAEEAFDTLLGHIDGMFDENHGTTTSKKKTQVGKGADSARTAATEATGATLTPQKRPK